jgi:hypothetical protein
MANNPQPPIAAAVTTTPSGLGASCRSRPSVCCALEEKGSPPRGKKVVFDEELSVNTVSSGVMRFEVPA